MPPVGLVILTVTGVTVASVPLLVQLPQAGDKLAPAMMIIALPPLVEMLVSPDVLVIFPVAKIAKSPATEIFDDKVILPIL